MRYVVGSEKGSEFVVCPHISLQGGREYFLGSQNPATAGFFFGTTIDLFCSSCGKKHQFEILLL